MLDMVKESLRKAVYEGGGLYVGIWEVEHMRLVLFNSPTTGSTLALPTHLVTAQTVREEIEASDAKF